LTQTERGKTISFFNELDTETRTMLVTSVSFFNEVALETQKLSSEVVSFFNELEIRKPCSKTSVSFFNEVASETQKLSSKPLFHFLTRLKSENHAQSPLFHFLTRKLENFLRDAKNYPRNLFLIMDSKRTMLRNDTMSRDKTQSWLPRGLHWKEETHSGRTPCRGSRQE
jgi:hypothetical protein